MQTTARALSLLLLFASWLALSAQGLKIKVFDPDHRPIAGAQVQALRPGTSKIVAAATTTADGAARFSSLPLAHYDFRVLADGFAPARLHATYGDQTIELRIAVEPDNVVVTAAATPLTADQTAAPTETLDARQLTNLQPVSLDQALRFLPGAIVASSGQRGGQASLFVRGGESRYNKFLIDGVPVNDPGGTFDLGVIPMQQVDRIEFTRGPESAIYGTDAMTSTVQLFSATGGTHTPELRFGADGGNFATAHGYASLAGAYRRLDYNLFADQFNTEGNGANDDYSNSSAGANVGLTLPKDIGLRLRVRHSNNRSGVQNEFIFNGAQLLPPDMDQFARQNNFLASLALTFRTPGHWQHTLSGYEYHHRRDNVDLVQEAARTTPYGSQDYPFNNYADLNRAGFNYLGEWAPLEWAHSVVGYNYENENGYFGDLTLVGPGSPLTHGLRRNHTAFGEQFASFLRGRATVLASVSYVNNEYFGGSVLPRASATYALLRNTRLRAAYGQGIKEPRFEETFGIGVYGIISNPHLRPERNRSIEAGVTQSLLNDKLALSATYYHQNFTNQIEFNFDPNTFVSQYINLNRSFAQGAELEAHARINARTSLQSSYIYTSTQILSTPQTFDPLLVAGAPLLRRPKHAGSLLLNYSGARWGGDIGGNFIGRRPDEDFYGYNIIHAAGYARLDLGGWYALNHFATAYFQLENALNKNYNEVLGYPALPVNVRAGLRFRLGGDR